MQKTGKIQYFLILAVLAAATAFPILAHSQLMPRAQPGKAVSDPALARYQKILAGLDPQDLRSVGKALDYFATQLKGAPPAGRDQAYFEFREFWKRAAQLEDEKLQKRMNAFEASLKALTPNEQRQARARREQELSSDTLPIRAGLRVREAAEGAWVVDPQPDFFETHFGRLTSPVIRDYLALEREELSKIWVRDARLQISIAELARRVSGWDGYLAKYPKTPYLDQATFSRTCYLGAFLSGLGNSPIWEAKTHKLRPERKAAYEKYMKEHGATESGKLVAEQYAVYQKHGFTWSAELEADLRALRMNRRKTSWN